MKFELVATEFFVSQIEELDRKSKDLIQEKIKLILSNPLRFKRLHSKTIRNIFRVKLDIHNKEVRLIYAILSPNIILVCLLDRKNNYADLEKYLKGLK